jgi:hypothetical protein
MLCLKAGGIPADAQDELMNFTHCRPALLVDASLFPPPSSRWGIW